MLFAQQRDFDFLGANHVVGKRRGGLSRVAAGKYLQFLLHRAELLILFLDLLRQRRSQRVERGGAFGAGLDLFFGGQLAPHQVARRLEASVVNAGDGMHEHPTQALLDAYTIQETKGTLSGLKVVVVGDLLHSRVFRSNLQLLRKMGSRVVVTGPPTLMPPEVTALGVELAPTMDEAIEKTLAAFGQEIGKQPKWLH